MTDLRPRTRLMAVAWTGAALFVVSLGYFLYFYLVDLGRPAPGASNGWGPALLFDCALFLVFATHHSAMARLGAKGWVSRLAGAELERPIYVIVSSLLFLVTCAAWRRIPGIVYAPAFPLAWGLIVIQVLGVGLIARATRALDPLDLAGIRQVRTAGRPPPAPPPLNETGAYRLIRHPLYLGWILFVFGVPLMTADRLLFAALSTLYLILAIPWEERSLRRTYGEAYDRYAGRVRWRLIPGLY